MDTIVTAFEESGSGALALPEAPVAMPVQRLDQWDGPKPRRSLAAAFRDGSLIARVFVFGLAVLLTVYGTMKMVAVVGNEPTLLQSVLVVLFAATFGWIALAAANAILGFFVLALRPRREQLAVSAPLATRTAIVMPVYNEDIHRVARTLERMAEEIIAAGQGWHFDLFVLSDSNDPKAIPAEAEAARRLQRAMLSRLGVCYRRRAANTGRKAGNIADFVRRWGSAYDFMIVLDADSYMTADAMVGLVRAMESDPKAGLIQTAPRLAGRNTLFARLQQFAAAAYAPVLAAGIAAWHGRDGNYWGHNAIIRVRAFAEAGGLPELRGRKPFGGHILSHDFVEAALLRRAGWDIYMRPDIAGSYEETPPTLADQALRDRRWAQGNLQHTKILSADGLHWMSRLHLLNGIMSYVASPLWLLFLATGFVLAWQAAFVAPIYFPHEHALFPTWPKFDSEQALDLMRFALLILVLPKVLGLLAAYFDPRLRRGAGGAVMLTISVVIETLISALLAPVMMLLQTRFIIDIMMARDSGWQTQCRDDGACPLDTVARQHTSHSLIGLAAAVGLPVISTQLWMLLLPVWLGLCLAIPLIYAVGQRSVGEMSRRLRLFLIPEERQREEAALAAHPSSLEWDGPIATAQ